MVAGLYRFINHNRLHYCDHKCGERQAMSFKPRRGQTYFMLNSRFEVKETQNTGSQKARDRIKVGNCFKTAEQAMKFRLYVLELVETEKVQFDKRIAFAYGFITALALGGLVWSVIR